jgi:hypothetical protein
MSNLHLHFKLPGLHFMKHLPDFFTGHEFQVGRLYGPDLLLGLTADLG